MTTQEITTFIDDVPTDVYQKPLMTAFQKWLQFGDEDSSHDVISVLQRPVNVFEGSFLSTATSAVARLVFPDILLQNSPNLVNKLNFFLYLRANIHVKLVFNATPFMAGRYYMFFSPFEGFTNRPIQSAAQQFTGYPGVEIDLASNAPVELIIPYCSPLSDYNLINTHSTMGDLIVHPLNVITSGESTTDAGFQIFAWFEDIHLRVPTSLPVSVPTAFHAQGLMEDVVKNAGNPTISGIAGTIGNISSIASAIVPELAPVSKAVEWVSRAVGGAASMLGFNKPTNLAANTPFTNIPAKSYTNADGLDMSVKLATIPDNNTVVPSGLFSTSADEMDINYVISKSCIRRVDIQWAATSVVGDIILDHWVNPAYAHEASAGYFAPTLLNYVTNMATYWRGSIKYRLTAAKTAFHSGRLRIAFHPGITGLDYESYDLEDQNVFNWIFDLSLSSEIEFTVPYVSNVPYKRTTLSGKDIDGKFGNIDYNIGLITFTVLTPLRYTTTVADYVSLNLWHAGGEDMTFSIWDSPNFVIGKSYPMTFDTAFSESKRKYLDKKRRTFGNRVLTMTDPTPVQWQRALNGMDVPGDCDFHAQVFNETSAVISHNDQMAPANTENVLPKGVMDPTAAEEMCMGEKVTNLRTLTRRFLPTFSAFSPREGDNLALPIKDSLLTSLTIDPAYFGAYLVNSIPYTTLCNTSFAATTGTPAGLKQVQYAVDNSYATSISLMSYIYRFYTGGMRYKIFFGGSYISDRSRVLPTAKVVYTNPVVRAQVYRNPKPIVNGAITAPSVDIGTFGPGLLTQNPCLYSHTVQSNTNGVLEVELPYFSKLPINLVGSGVIPSTDGDVLVRNSVTININPSNLYNQFVAVADTDGTTLQPTSSLQSLLNSTVLQGAADDFTFGYLVGTPTVKIRT